jgi:Spy/CpxP family protein refolding chaperone
MKRLVMLAILAMGISGSLFAQSRMTEAQKEEFIARHEANMQALGLSEEQKPQVEAINMNYFRALSALKGSEVSKLEKYRSFKSASSTRDEEMKKVLTKEQYKIYKDNQSEQRDQMRERRRSRN